MTRTVLLHAIVLPLAASAGSPVSAQEYPAKPVRLVLGFSAGSGVDVSARVIAQKLNEVS